MTQNEYIAALREALEVIADANWQQLSAQMGYERRIADLQEKVNHLRSTAKEALALPVPSAWLPIETAPKDGLPILAYNPTGRMVGASFHIAWFSPDEMAGGGVWHNSRGAIGYHSDHTNRREGDLTHWMPLPTPPESEA